MFRMQKVTKVICGKLTSGVRIYDDATKRKSLSDRRISPSTDLSRQAVQPTSLDFNIAVKTVNPNSPIQNSAGAASITDGFDICTFSIYYGNVSNHLAYLYTLKIALNCVKKRINVPAHIYSQDKINFTTESATKKELEKYSELYQQLDLKLKSFDSYDFNELQNVGVLSTIASLLRNAFKHKSYQYNERSK
jgi:hypothetical protein